ncbi:hybrid sensor histidine kinase/response regulator [Hyalangium sp.]|uniref:sensor histidine kinase n=1 Tax=Hyalangium sp. TaxID=2028555 RepID=UPI002D6CB3D9|nr:hybrid sensor histidine kinase/response regulator [Hyalangium sp.]HYH95968.1 hybrid sensor histidine kinase/response regulator [Hyalangium sp.]
MHRQPLRLLLIEDSEDDEILLLEELRSCGYEPSHTRVESLEDLDRALHGGTWDAIISDYVLPGFNGLTALEQVQQRGIDLPFLIVSGAVGEDTAVAAMKSGVHDFLFKDRLGRLGPALARELREAKVRADRQRMQEQLLLSDRLAALGLLAAGVAHEINNPLASLRMNLDFTLSRSRERALPEDDVQALRNASECAELIQEIVRDIKIFARPEEQDFGPTNLHRVLDSALRMAWNQVFPRAQLIKDYGDDATVHGSQARLAQIFLNLVINAAQSIPDGNSSEHEIRVVTRREQNGSVRVEIRDTGPGIPPELIERIFDPFFTTKPLGVGTGLGLFICRRLVTEMGGTIGVQSHPGRGSLFWVHLRGLL